MMKIKITKISDDAYNGNHPNDINKGFTQIIEREVLQLPMVGLNFQFGDLRTSKVVKILENGIFKTENSTYKLQFV